MRWGISPPTCFLCWCHILIYAANESLGIKFLSYDDEHRGKVTVWFCGLNVWDSLTTKSCNRLRQTSNLSRTKSQILNVSRLLLQLSLSNQLSRWSWSSADRRCSNSIRVINNRIAYKVVTYVRGFTVYETYLVMQDTVTSIRDILQVLPSSGSLSLSSTRET